MFEDDLGSDEAKEVHRRLRRPGPPIPNDVEGDFERRLYRQVWV